jgi:hypothetical protein
MPSTRVLITRAMTFARGWNRDGTKGILPVLDEINRYMMSKDAEVNIAINSATGQPPYLATTSGTRQYTMADTVRKVASVYQLRAEENYSDTGFDDISLFPYATWQGKEYYEIPITTRPKTRNSNALVYFRENPGTTTNRYFLKSYTDVTEISSENIDIDVPEKFHDLVLDGVLARIRQTEYGELDQWQTWRDRVAMEYWDEMNENPYRNTLTPIRYA